jgi:hypothetical protein
MNDLLETEIFSLMAATSKEVTNEEMQNAYAHFIKQVETVSSSEDNSVIFRTLKLTRIELTALASVFQYEQGEKCA